MKLDRVIAVRNNKTIYRDDDKCIKVFDESYSKAEVLYEATNHARIEETGLNIPKILEVTMIDGKWAIVSEYIKGKTLASLMDEAQTEQEKEKYMNLFVDLQISVHSKKCALLAKLKDRLNRKICMTSLDATTRYDLHTRLEDMPKHSKICHGDFNPSNIVVACDGTPYIIDWAHVTQGNASADAARTYFSFCLAGKAQEAKRYLELFCEKSNITKQYVKKWMPIVAASQSVDSNETEREFLLAHVDSQDCE